MIIKNKKIFLYIFLAIILIATIAGLTVFALKTIEATRTQSTQQVEKSDINNIKDQAMQALINNDFDKAKKLFQDAQKQYENMGDTNNAVDAKMQLYLIDSKIQSIKTAPELSTTTAL